MNKVINEIEVDKVEKEDENKLVESVLDTLMKNGVVEEAPGPVVVEDDNLDVPLLDIKNDEVFNMIKLELNGQFKKEDVELSLHNPILKYPIEKDYTPYNYILDHLSSSIKQDELKITNDNSKHDNITNDNIKTINVNNESEKMKMSQNVASSVEGNESLPKPPSTETKEPYAKMLWRPEEEEKDMHLISIDNPGQDLKSITSSMSSETEETSLTSTETNNKNNVLFIKCKLN